MKFIPLLVMTFLICLKSVAQNLLSNQSFEQHSLCPDGENDIPYASGWLIFLLTPDYFNACADVGSGFSVPTNWGTNSFQYAYAGNAYAGFFAYWTEALTNPGDIVRELIATNLNQPLVPDNEYAVKMFVSLASFIPTPCASSNIGFKFTTQSFEAYGTDSIYSPLINNSAVIYVDSLITDTTGWTEVSGSFVADSAYQYLVIGNFFDNDNTDTLLLGPAPLCYTYYYVDNVSVKCISAECLDAIESVDEAGGITIFPNPLGNEFFIQMPDEVFNAEFKLINILGMEQQAFFTQVPNDNETKIKVKVSEIESGMYFIVVTAPHLQVVKSVFLKFQNKTYEIENFS